MGSSPQRRNVVYKGREAVRESRRLSGPSSPVRVSEMPRLSELNDEKASVGQGTGIQVSLHVAS